MAPTHYEMLGVAPEHASAEALRRAYRERSLLCHPDKTDDPAAEGAFIALNAAYATLADPRRRGRYDRTLAGAAHPLLVPLTIAAAKGDLPGLEAAAARAADAAELTAALSLLAPATGATPLHVAAQRGQVRAGPA